jgi:hypothetical protein
MDMFYRVFFPITSCSTGRKKCRKIINGLGVIDACAPAQEISNIAMDQSRAEAAAASQPSQPKNAPRLSLTF